MTSAIHSQITSFLDGFYELVPVELISVFTPTELELLISGLPDIDIDDLRIHTDYHQYRVADETIQWFWNVLRGFTREEKALFLQFVTGTSKVRHRVSLHRNLLDQVPLDGFDHLQGMRGPQRFSIHRAYTDLGNLPTAHTCFNQVTFSFVSHGTVLPHPVVSWICRSTRASKTSGRSCSWQSRRVPRVSDLLRIDREETWEVSLS
jgi:E3 ubiquitin-protein ligase HUWE1